MSPPLSIPERLPVMMLSGCNLFPHGLLPLHIFEQRYREMLSFALETERMFCIGTLVAPEQRESPSLCLHPASTAGFVRACVAQPDGCSNLLLQGVQRIRLSDFETDRSYVTAAATPVRTLIDNYGRVLSITEEVRSLALELIEVGGKDLSDQVRDHLFSVEDPELLADLVAYHFLTAANDRQLLIAEACLQTRLGLLRDQLERCLIKGGPGEDSDIV